MFNSIRWKFVLIYFILVFIAMVIAGAFIINAFEDFHQEETVKKLDKVAGTVISMIEDVDDLDAVDSQKTIEGVFQSFEGTGILSISEEVYIVDSNATRVVAATNTAVIGKKAEEIVKNWSLIVIGLNGKEGEFSTGIDDSGRTIMERVYPIRNEGVITGVLYLKKDQSDIENTLAKSRDIILKATILSSFVTILLGFVITRTITEPIKAITEMAGQMAKGNFGNFIEVKSDDEIGKLAGMFNYLNNRLRKSLSDISREKSKVEAIVNYMTDGVIAVDKKGKIIHINPKALQLLDTELSIDHSWSFDEVIVGYNENLRIEDISNSYDDWVGSDIIYIEDTIIKVNFAPFENDSDEVAGLIFVLQDVTQIERLDKMRREFVANVSHELKTPLTSIKSYVETILDGLVDDRETTMQFLKVVDSEADRMTRLVRDLLQLSNFDTHEMKFRFFENNFIELVRNAIVKLEVTARKKEHKIKLITDVQSLNGIFDYDRMEQVILNILSNAIKYTPENGLIEIFVLNFNDEVLIKISDNGLGIPEDDISRIFERFYRVDKARSRQMGGTGLGLSIAKEIIEGHDGEIKIVSEMDKGTTVSISIPIKRT